MEKRLIALMVAGVITVGTMTGCSSKDVDSSIVRDNFFGDGRVGDEYIIIKQNDTHILHKGKYTEDIDGSVHGFVFDCGEDFLSNAEHFVSYQEPNAERYDEKCEDCFDLNK